MFTKSLILFQKFSTKLTGLEVVSNPQAVLKKIYEKTMTVLNEMPKESHYRISTEALINQRLKHLNLDVETIEKNNNCGQIEELIKQAEGELNLARNMLNWRAWEPLEEEAPENQWKWPI